MFRYTNTEPLVLITCIKVIFIVYVLPRTCHILEIFQHCANIYFAQHFTLFLYATVYVRINYHYLSSDSPVEIFFETSRDSDAEKNFRNTWGRMFDNKDDVIGSLHSEWRHSSDYLRFRLIYWNTIRLRYHWIYFN